MEYEIMKSKQDPLIKLIIFVVIGFILSVYFFSENTSSPSKFNDQPQYFLANTY